jgi:hypothetical protein
MSRLQLNLVSYNDALQREDLNLTLERNILLSLS